MKVFDASTLLHSDLVVWEGDERFKKTIGADIVKDQVEVSEIVMSTHTGTHIDAPRHFIEGAPGLDSFPVESFVGPCLVVDMTGVEGNEIEPSDLEGVDLTGVERILFKTQNSVRKLLDQSEFTRDYVSLSVDTAKMLAKYGIKLVGVDYLSVEKKSNPGHPVHVAILEAGIVNVEGVRLIDIKPGQYDIAALPLNIKDSDGSPARVVLMQ